jgi:pilus assembly protein Flp/PilA
MCPGRSPAALGILLNENYEEMKMKTLILNSLNRLHNDEAGQGLVEYLLILALVAFAATAGMTTLASGLNSAFGKIGEVLGSYIS